MNNAVNVVHERGFLSIWINSYNYVADIRCWQNANAGQDPESLCRALEGKIDEYLKDKPKANTKDGDVIDELVVWEILKDLTSENINVVLSIGSKYKYIRNEKKYDETGYDINIAEAKTILPAPEGTVLFSWDGVFFKVLSFAYFTDEYKNGFLFVFPIVLRNGKHYLENDCELVDEEPRRNGVSIDNPGIYCRTIPILDAMDFYFNYLDCMDYEMHWEEYRDMLAEMGLTVIENNKI